MFKTSKDIFLVFTLTPYNLSLLVVYLTIYDNLLMCNKDRKS